MNWLHLLQEVRWLPISLWVQVSAVATMIACYALCGSLMAIHSVPMIPIPLSTYLFFITITIVLCQAFDLCAPLVIRLHTIKKVNRSIPRLIQWLVVIIIKRFFKVKPFQNTYHWVVIITTILLKPHRRWMYLLENHLLRASQSRGVVVSSTPSRVDVVIVCYRMSEKRKSS